MSYRKLVRLIVKNEGYCGLYKGLVIYTVRAVPGWGAYFYSYEYFKALFRSDALKLFKNNNHPQRREFIIDIIAGGLAGQVFWALGYPLDIIKTQIQASNERVKFKDIVLKEYKAHGYSYFFRGLSAALLRAFPVNAVTLVSFDYLKKWIKKD